jgi:hypothetical protein
MNFLTLQTHVLRNLGNRQLGGDIAISTLVKEWINSCYVDLVTTGKFPELNRFAPIPVPTLEGKDSFLTGVGIDYYSYPTDGLTITALYDVTNDMPLVQRDMATLLKNKDLQPGKPRYYATYGNKIYVDPTPDSALYTIQRLYRKKVTDAVLIEDIDVPIIGVEWHEAIEIGATYRGKRSLGDPSMEKWLTDLKSYIMSHSEQQSEEEEDFDGGFSISL